MYIHKKTYEFLDGIIPRGIDWLEIPKDAEAFAVWDNPFQCAFYKDDFKVIYDIEDVPVDFRGWVECPNMSREHVLSFGEIIWERCTVKQQEETKPIKSDGGSSDYYKREIPELMLQRWKEEGVIEAKDVMKLFLGNDYNFSNSFKAHCRVQSLREGVGKEGADEKYDLRKAWFFCEDSYNDCLERGEFGK